MKRDTDLTDAHWNQIKPLLPPPAHTGRPRADDRRTLNGILFAIAHRCRWRDIPEEYGSHITCWRRHRNWSEDGTLNKVLKIVRGDRDPFDSSWEEAEAGPLQSVG